MSPRSAGRASASVANHIGSNPDAAIMTWIVRSSVMSWLARNRRASVSLNGFKGMSAITGKYSPHRSELSACRPDIVVMSVAGKSP